MGVGRYGREMQSKKVYFPNVLILKISLPSPPSLVFACLLSKWATHRTTTGQKSPALQPLSFRNGRDQTETVKPLSK